MLSREHGIYSDRRVRKIISRYVEVATGVGLDPLAVVAQMVLETGNLTSFWSQPPRRNPAGIGVTGLPGEGISFESWRQAIRAHVGRLVAYAVKPGRESPAQLELVTMALQLRPLPDSLRGAAPTLAKLSGTWASDPEYADKISTMAEGNPRRHESVPSGRTRLQGEVRYRTAGVPGGPPSQPASRLTLDIDVREDAVQPAGQPPCRLSHQRDHGRRGVITSRPASNTAVAKPTPNCLMVGSGLMMKLANTEPMISAAAVVILPLVRSPEAAA